ncbi:MAG TPA: polysaccharide pyruvyl transferase family protein [Verrucomicrobiae bacterium]|nr:polysaccharide pyruvyl transferase family protein [Verrucomicrobiae bacterium]
MKVGIITVHSVPNYGAVLQAYALATYLQKTGRTVHTIDYRQPQLEEMYRLRWKLPPPVNHWIRLRRNTRFVESQLPLSPRRYRSVDEFIPDVGNYDAFIAGSDQVWFTGPVQYFDPMFFLNFPVNGQRKISYAASSGGTTAFGEFESQVKNALADFDHVGVRDSHTANLVAPLSPSVPVQVVDPVFLCDFGDLIDPKPPLSEPYLLVFGDFTRGLGPALQKIIEATGLKTVVSLQYPCHQATKRIPSPGPAEWLSWFRHASFVVTSYFHGTAIAAKFERPFISIPTPGRRIKVATMLDWMHLSSRCLLDSPSPEAAAALAIQPIDWNRSRAALQEQIKVSQQFIETALK